jgi:hypothetical protein
MRGNRANLFSIKGERVNGNRLGTGVIVSL